MFLKYFWKSLRCLGSSWGQKRSRLHLLRLKFIEWPRDWCQQRSVERELLCKQGGIVLTVCDEALFACPPLCASDMGTELGWRPPAVPPLLSARDPSLPISSRSAVSLPRCVRTPPRWQGWVMAPRCTWAADWAHCPLIDWPSLQSVVTC